MPQIPRLVLRVLDVAMWLVLVIMAASALIASFYPASFLKLITAWLVLAFCVFLMVQDVRGRLRRWRRYRELRELRASRMGL